MSLKKCCCFYAPTIIVLDLIMIMLLIGEFILIFPNKQVSLLDSEVDAYGLPKESIDFNTTSIDAKKFKLWEGSSYSVFVIPINTFLVFFGIRLLFCKLNLEVMKFILIIDLLLIYIFTLLGLILYLTATSQPDKGDNFK